MPLRGDRLRDLRLQRAYTHEELAGMLDLGMRQVHRYESGETDPSGEIITRIAKVFGVTTDYLLGLVDDPVASLTEQDLTPMERKLILALRQGLIVEALKTVAAISESDDKTGIASDQEAVKR